jgi:thioredoxin
MSQVSAVDTARFQQEVLEASATRPVLVDFWAAWCGPCRMLAPVLEQAAAEFSGRLTVVKVDTDAEPALAARYAIRSIPAVKLFRDGKVVAEFVGAQPLQAIRQFLAPHLSADAAPDAAPDAADDPTPPMSESRKQALARFAQIAASPDETDAIQTARVTAARDAGRGDLDAALEGLFAAATRNRRYARGEGRADLLAVFELLPEDDPRLGSARRRLAGLLN